jgi:hypothetical protein
MTDEEDAPNHEDMDAAAGLVHDAHRTFLPEGVDAPLIECPATLKLVLDTAWKIRGNRMRREDYERCVAKPEMPIERDTFNP